MLCVPSRRGGTEHQVFSVQDEFLTFSGVKRMERKGGLPRGLLWWFVTTLVSLGKADGLWGCRLGQRAGYRPWRCNGRRPLMIGAVVQSWVSLCCGTLRGVLPGARASTLLVLSRPSGRGGAAREARAWHECLRPASHWASLMREIVVKKLPLSLPPLGGGGDVTGRGDTTEKVCAWESTVSCACFFFLVSQCHSVTERGCREEGVYSWSWEFRLL